MASPAAVDAGHVWLASWIAVRWSWPQSQLQSNPGAKITKTKQETSTAKKLTTGVRELVSNGDDNNTTCRPRSATCSAWCST